MFGIILDKYFQIITQTDFLSSENRIEECFKLKEARIQLGNTLEPIVKSEM